MLKKCLIVWGFSLYSPAYTKQFERDIKKIKKRKKDTSKLKSVIKNLLSSIPLAVRFRNHKLVGSYSGRWECHIEPDWLLIYKYKKDIIIFEKTGSHSDLFK